MVCAKCEKKLAKAGGLACTDVWRPTGSGGDRNQRKVGENKLLSSKARFSPYAPSSSSSKGSSASGSAAGSSGKGVGGKGDRGSVTFGQCETCRVTVARAGAKYCQSCAYKKGVCAICAKQVLDTRGYAMSAK